VLKGVPASRVKGRASEPCERACKRAVLKGVQASRVKSRAFAMGGVDDNMSFVKYWSDGLQTKTHTMHAYTDRRCCVKGRARWVGLMMLSFVKSWSDGLQTASIR
jgi:hypothetical protein